MTIRVLLVDDHQIVRQGVRALLDPDVRFEVVGEAGTGAEALELTAEQHPDIILQDLKLPDISGPDLCANLLKASPDSVVLILTAYFDQNLVNACLRSGARGYLLKDAENLHLEEQLMAVARGHAVFDPRAAGVLTEIIRQGRLPADLLSPRELQVLILIADGLTNKEIGEQLFISENTVKGYVREILAKLDVRNRLEAVVQAKERGLL